MKTLRSELLHLQYLLNTKELSMEGIALFLRHNGYRVRHIPQEKALDVLSDLQQRDE